MDSRRLAYDLLHGVEADAAYANLLMPKLLTKAKLEPRDGAFAQELAFGVLRNAIRYDAIIRICAGREPSAIDAEALIVLRIGAHQLLEMRVPTHAAISETVELAKRVLRPSLSGFVNGVLRRVSERSTEDWLEAILDGVSDRYEALSIEYSHPKWIVLALSDALRSDGREADLEDLLAIDNQPPKVSLVALPGITRDGELAAAGAKEAGLSPLGYELLSGDPGRIDAVSKGRARVQDQGSQLVTLALEAAGSALVDGEEWLDLCAGPGGKAALLAALATRDSAELVCNELQPHRAKLVEQALRPFAPDVYVRTGDGRELGADAPEAFDRVLLDAPCSGLGALRRRTESRYRKQASDIADLTKLQRELLESAIDGTKSGGVIAYVTCSPHLAETNGVVDWALSKHGESIELLDATAVFCQLNQRFREDPSVALNPARKTVQLWPHRHGTDAMFLALFRKL